MVTIQALAVRTWLAVHPEFFVETRTDAGAIVLTVWTPDKNKILAKLRISPAKLETLLTQISQLERTGT